MLTLAKIWNKGIPATFFLESAITRSVLPNKKFTGLPGEKKYIYLLKQIL